MWDRARQRAKIHGGYEDRGRDRAVGGGWQALVLAIESKRVAFNVMRQKSWSTTVARLAKLLQGSTRSGHVLGDRKMSRAGRDALGRCYGGGSMCSKRAHADPNDGRAFGVAIRERRGREGRVDVQLIYWSSDSVRSASPCSLSSIIARARWPMSGFSFVMASACASALSIPPPKMGGAPR